MMEGNNDGQKKKSAPKYFFPKKIILGNKKDLRKNKMLG